MSRRPPSLPPSSPVAADLDSAILDDPSLVVLRAGARRVVLAPALGGAIAAFYDAAASGPVHWFRPTGRAALDGGDPLQMASFPLLPYCNRIRDGRFRFDGREWQLPMGSGPLRHALHGHAWRLPWEVVARNGSSAELRFGWTPAADAGSAAVPGWPFRYEARQRFELSEAGLVLRLSARNLDSGPMPFGFGLHPYYPRTPRTRVETRVRAIWHSDGELLPTSLGAHPAVDALGGGLVLDAFALDNNFTGWSREAVIHWPESRRRLTMRADAPLDHFVLYSPAGEPFFCAEPVSNTTDWLNLDLPADERGGGVLAPGESVAATVSWLPASDD